MIKRFALALLFLVGYVHTARAEPRFEMHASVEPQVVEVGDVFTYQVQGLVHDGAMPTDPQPGPLGRFVIKGSRTTAIPQMDFTLNGRRSLMTGILASWTLQADREGTFTIGPGSVLAGGSRRVAPPVKIKVVAKGQAPRRADPLASPLSPFVQLFDMNDDARRPPDPPMEPKLALDVARAPVAFLHARIDKTHAVVGEQVTFTVLLYEDPFAHQGQPRDIHEANTPDFFKRSLSEDDMATTNLGFAMVGDKQWRVKQVRKNALFPMKAGRLAIEPMSLTFPGARVGLRESETLYVDVTEPPLAGRPPGYVVGDVGDMSLSAIVAPRQIREDGAIGVTVELRGVGNLPETIAMPVSSGLEWLEAQKNAKLGDAGQDRFGGSRTFSYVLRIHKAGTIDLGEVKVPFYDPVKKAYGVARASLGIAEVTAGSGRSGARDEAEKVLEGLPSIRRELEGTVQASYISERPAYWAFLFGSPAACGIAIAGARIARRARDRRVAASTSPDKLARDRVSEAEKACQGDDGGAAVAAVARAVTATVLAKTGVNVRGAAGATAVRELEEADVANASAIVAVLRACEDARFSPAGTTIEEARKLWSRAKDALAGMGK